MHPKLRSFQPYIPAEESTEVVLKSKGPEKEGGRVSPEEPSLNVYAEATNAGAIGSAAMSVPEERQVQGAEQGAVCREAEAINSLMKDIRSEASLVLTFYLTNVDTNDAGGSELVSIPVEQEAPSATRIEFPPTDAEIGSPPLQTNPKACQLTIVACLAEFRTRSRSPLPIPPQSTPSSRRPRHSLSRGNTSPLALKLVSTVSPTKSASKVGKMTGEPKLYLDAILSKLSPLEQAKYLWAKTKVKSFSFLPTYLDCQSASPIESNA